MQTSGFRLIPIAFVAILFSLVSLLVGCGDKDEKSQKQEPALQVKVAQVAKRGMPLSMEFVGQTKGSIDAEIRARVEGVLTGIHFEEGKEVSEGQLLYTIDAAAFNAKVSEAKGKLAEVETRYTKAESDLKRVRPLVQMKALSERDLDTAVANESGAKAAVEAARAALDSANIELGYCKIYSPTKGVIGLSAAKVGEFVGKAPNPIVLNTVSNLNPINVRFSVTEKEYLYFARLKQKQLEAGETPQKRVLQLILADGSAYSESGEVASADRQIDSKTGTLTVEASFPNPHQLIKPGQYGKIRSVIETVTGALVVPKTAIRELQGQQQLFVVKADNTVEQHTVKLGLLVEGLQVVESGVAEGEKVVLDNLQRMRSGILVTPISGAA